MIIFWKMNIDLMRFKEDGKVSSILVMKVGFGNYESY